MSYFLHNRVFASGHTALTVPGNDSLTQATISVDGIAKATDSVVVTLDRNSASGVAVNALPYIYVVTDGASFTVSLQLTNGDPTDATCFLNWAVCR